MESEVLKEIIWEIITFREDHEHLKITDFEVKELILDHIDTLAKEILQEVDNY